MLRPPAPPARRPAALLAPPLALPLLAVLLAGCGASTTAAGPGATSAPGAAGTSSGAASSPAAGLSVVASTDVWGDVARTVGGDAVTVTSFIDDPAQDPHSFEADARNQLAVADATVLVENGGGYDDFMQTLITASGSTAPVVDAVAVSGRQAAAGAELNEHVWYDVPTVAKVADALAGELAQADPSQAAAFTARADALKARLAGIEAAEAQVRAAAAGTGVAITEPVPGYLLEACGLVDETPEEFSEAVEEGTDVSPAVLAETEALFTGGRVKALVYNEQTTGAETEAVLAAARAGGVAVVPVTETLPAGQDYATWMTSNLAAVAAAVGAPASALAPATATASATP